MDSLIISKGFLIIIPRSPQGRAMQAKTLTWLFVGIVIGLIAGYAASLPIQNSLQAKIASLEEKLSPKYVEKIKARGKLIVGTSADWPPFEYGDKEGNFAGIDIEIAKKIAEALGVELEIKDMKFAALIEALRNGQIDMILADMTPTAEREQLVDFSIPYYFSKGNAVVTTKDRLSEFREVDDLKGKNIGVQLGTIQEEWAKENLGDKANIISYDRVYPEMVMALKRGDIDVMVVGDIIASVIIEKDPDLAIAFYAGGTRIGAAVAVPQGAEDLKYVVNSVLEKMLETGEMEQIFKEEIAKWLGAGS